jgi:hypothetical protein
MNKFKVFLKEEQKNEFLYFHIKKFYMNNL